MKRIILCAVFVVSVLLCIGTSSVSCRAEENGIDVSSSEKAEEPVSIYDQGHYSKRQAKPFLKEKKADWSFLLAFFGIIVAVVIVLVVLKLLFFSKKDLEFGDRVKNAKADRLLKSGNIYKKR